MGLPWRTFGPILAIHFFGTLGFSLVIPFLVFIVSDLGGASWTYGLLGATYSAFQFAGAPVLGRWSDRTGRRPVLAASQGGTFAAWVLFLLALSMPVQDIAQIAGASVTLPLVLVFGARALDGATGGNISVANAFVADLTRDTPELRQIAFGRMGMASNLGFVIGPAMAGLLGGTSWGPRLPIALSAGIAALTTAAILTWLREPQGRCSEPHAPPTTLEAELHQQPMPCDRTPPPVFGAALRRGPVAALLVATFVIFLGFNLFYAAFPVHAMAAYGWNTGRLGTFFALLSGMMILAQGPLLTIASRRLGHRSVFAAGMACMSLSMLTLVAPGGFVTLAGAALFAIGNGLSWPTFQARVAEAGGDTQGVVQGATTSASSLASIVGLVAGGLLYPPLQGALFLAAALLFVVVLVLTPLWFPKDVEGNHT